MVIYIIVRAESCNFMVFSKNLRFFPGTHDLELQIEKFLNSLSESALAFESALDIYFEKGCSTEFLEKHDQVDKLESLADDLRRKIEIQLYAHTLIPESRGDVLGLLENLDKIINLLEGVLWGFSIEKPEIPEKLKDKFQRLTKNCCEAVEAVVLGSRAFFRDIGSVKDHNHKVMYFETEADKISTGLKQEIFESDMELGKKLHLRGFVEQIDDIADWSEDVADRLTIYVIKRTI